MAVTAGSSAMIVVSKSDEASTYGAYLSYFHTLRHYRPGGVRLIVLETHSHDDLLNVLRGYMVKDGDERLLREMQLHLVQASALHEV